MTDAAVETLRQIGKKQLLFVLRDKFRN